MRIIFFILILSGLSKVCGYTQELKLGLPIGHSSWVNSAKFSPDGLYVVTVSQDHTAKVWEVLSGKLLYTLEGHEDALYSVEFSPDGRYVLTSSGDKTAKVWEFLSPATSWSAVWSARPLAPDVA